MLVSASTATDPSQDDYPTSISVYDGTKSIGYVSCQSNQTCQGSVKWNATGLSGPHTLTATVRTNRGVSVTSAPIPVTIVSPAPTVTITNPRRGASLRRRITVKVSGRTDRTQVDYPSSISVYDGTSSIGYVSCQGQQICAGSVTWDARSLSGRHVLTAVIRTDTGRSATSPPVTVGARAKRKVTPRCTLSSSSVRLRQKVTGRCTMPGVPAGTRAAVQYRSGGRWKTAVGGRVASGGRFRFVLRGARHRTFDFWILVRPSSRTLSARAHIGTLRIG
jgi:hypothetical protein